MENQKPEALRLADKYEIEGFLQDHRFAKDHWCRQAAAELRRLHARVEELESVGANHIAQPTQMATTTVVLPEPIGTVGAAPGTSGFTLTVFEAARVPVGTNIYTEQQVRELLATGSQPQTDARDAELVAAVVYASTEAMNSSMESPSFDGTIILESHHAASLSLALDELEQHRAAIAAAKEI